MSPFSLPTQRCFFIGDARPSSASLFSAYAEVFPWLGMFSQSERRFSLPTQRCFHKEPSCTPTESAFLCLRRGVSHMNRHAANSSGFSLPTQRCFRRLITRFLSGGLFSAYAEVFLALAEI